VNKWKPRTAPPQSKLNKSLQVNSAKSAVKNMNKSLGSNQPAYDPVKMRREMTAISAAQNLVKLKEINGMLEEMFEGGVKNLFEKEENELRKQDNLARGQCKRPESLDSSDPDNSLMKAYKKVQKEKQNSLEAKENHGRNP